jgi:hypothetical protein
MFTSIEAYSELDCRNPFSKSIFDGRTHVFNVMKCEVDTSGNCDDFSKKCQIIVDANGPRGVVDGKFCVQVINC